MDSSQERETHDFMNVDSFSKLPFIRPAPPPPPLKDKPIRLFGIDVATQEQEEEPERESDTERSKESESSTESGRRFECHYCCRNFPTSQALGGHQNAHKRERQHAKRAHLQSTFIHHHHHNSTFSDGLYGLVNYRPTQLSPPISYPSWNNNGNTYHHSSRYYGSFSQPPPINGSPMGTWNGSSSMVNHDRSFQPLPIFSSNVRNPPSSSQVRYVYQGKTSVQDHVSLDLHL